MEHLEIKRFLRRTQRSKFNTFLGHRKWMSDQRNDNQNVCLTRWVYDKRDKWWFTARMICVQIIVGKYSTKIMITQLLNYNSIQLNYFDNPESLHASPRG